jgi:multidrug efflux pump subunit AcrA (membrane-fusion protein)
MKMRDADMSRVFSTITARPVPERDPVAPSTDGTAPSDSIGRIALAGWLIIGLFFGGVGAWATTAPLNGAVVANAVVKVDGNRKSIQHLDGGIIK